MGPNLAYPGRGKRESDETGQGAAGVASSRGLARRSLSVGGASAADLGTGILVAPREPPTGPKPGSAAQSSTPLVQSLTAERGCAARQIDREGSRRTEAQRHGKLSDGHQFGSRSG